MNISALRLYEGWLSHKRMSPVEHEFRYKVFQIWLDVKQPQLLDTLSRWWSSSPFNLVHFDRRNYLPSKQPLYDEVLSVIEQQTGKAFAGDVYMLSNLSYWGHCYNPVTFFACYDNGVLQYFISEIHNTPWGERFCYVHDVSLGAPTNTQADAQLDTNNKKTHVAHFDKNFHVSPFMPMGLRYEWRYTLSEQRSVISMNLSQDDTHIFNATLNLKGHDLTTKTANRLPFKYPFMCAKVVLAIYWQALKLWIKRVPFYRHPISGKAP